MNYSDFDLHGISPIYDQAIFVRCQLCQFIIKLPQLAEHLQKRHDITDDVSLIETITNQHQEKIAVEEEKVQSTLPSSSRNRKTSRSLKNSNLPNDLNCISNQQVSGNKILKSSPLKSTGKKQTNSKTFKSTNLKLLNENINEFINQPDSTIPLMSNGNTITNNLAGINGIIIKDNSSLNDPKIDSNLISNNDILKTNKPSKLNLVANNLNFIDTVEGLTDPNNNNGNNSDIKTKFENELLAKKKNQKNDKHANLLNFNSSNSEQLNIEEDNSLFVQNCDKESQICNEVFDYYNKNNSGMSKGQLIKVSKVYDPNKHCGVIVHQVDESNGNKPITEPCTRSLSCKKHSINLRRQVVGRSKSFNELFKEYRDEKLLTNNLNSNITNNINTNNCVDETAHIYNNNPTIHNNALQASNTISLQEQNTINLDNSKSNLEFTNEEIKTNSHQNLIINLNQNNNLNDYQNTYQNYLFNNMHQKQQPVLPSIFNSNIKAFTTGVIPTNNQNNLTTSSLSNGNSSNNLNRPLNFDDVSKHLNLNYMNRMLVKHHPRPSAVTSFNARLTENGGGYTLWDRRQDNLRLLLTNTFNQTENFLGKNRSFTMTTETSTNNSLNSNNNQTNDLKIITNGSKKTISNASLKGNDHKSSTNNEMITNALNAVNPPDHLLKPQKSGKNNQQLIVKNSKKRNIANIPNFDAPISNETFQQNISTSRFLPTTAKLTKLNEKNKPLYLNNSNEFLSNFSNETSYNMKNEKDILVEEYQNEFDNDKNYLDTKISENKTKFVKEESIMLNGFSNNNRNNHNRTDLSAHIHLDRKSVV